MKHITSTALEAGAQEICAESAASQLAGMGAIAQQPAFRPILRRDVMNAVNICARDLGLRQGSVVVLDALLSCLPCQNENGRESVITPTTLLTVYASNDTLCFRAKGLTDRQLRRHLETLEKAGLIRRRDSANGKRFPVRRGGTVIGAFGLDLSPLFTRADELMALALRNREEAEELRGLRARILHLRATCLALPLDETIASFVDGLRNLMRRATLTLVEARAVLTQLNTFINESSRKKQPDITPHIATDINKTSQPEQDRETPQTDCERGTNQLIRADKLSVCAGHPVRHIEPKSDTKKTNQTTCDIPDWSELTEINAFYPEPHHRDDAKGIAFEFGQMLRISQPLLVAACTKLGLWELLKLENRMARSIDTIHSPDAWFRSALKS